MAGDCIVFPTVIWLAFWPDIVMTFLMVMIMIAALGTNYFVMGGLYRFHSTHWLMAVRGIHLDSLRQAIINGVARIPGERTMETNVNVGIFPFLRYKERHLVVRRGIEIGFWEAPSEAGPVPTVIVGWVSPERMKEAGEAGGKEIESAKQEVRDAIQRMISPPPAVGQDHFMIASAAVTRSHSSSVL